MAKFVGEIGFSYENEDADETGVWDQHVIERHYHGDIMNATYKWNDNQKVNEDLNISNKFSVVADSFAMKNLYNMLYVKWNGVKWKIITTELSSPRLILYVGGIYNGQTENRVASSVAGYIR